MIFRVILEAAVGLSWIGVESLYGGKVECILGVLLYIGFGIVIGAYWLRLLRQDRIC